MFVVHGLLAPAEAEVADGLKYDCSSFPLMQVLMQSFFSFSFCKPILQVITVNSGVLLLFFWEGCSLKEAECHWALAKGELTDRCKSNQSGFFADRSLVSYD